MGCELKACVIALVAVLAAGCSRGEPPRRYPLQGQVLAVHTDRQALTVKHADIPGFMPGMTMTFPVAAPKLMEGRAPGETITATLEISESTGRLVDIVHVGTAPLPADSNEVAVASGVLAVGDELPDAALIDQADRRRSLSEWKGTPTLVTFIYMRCPLPTFCPLMDQNFAAIQRAVADDDTLRGRVRLVSVSFDPEHDTPAQLSRHAAKLKADPAVWTFLTGDRVTIDRLAGRFGVGVIRTADGSKEITHNLRTTLIGADGRVAKIYSGGDWTPRTALADLRNVLRPSK